MPLVCLEIAFGLTLARVQLALCLLLRWLAFSSLGIEGVWLCTLQPLKPYKPQPLIPSTPQAFNPTAPSTLQHLKPSAFNPSTLQPLKLSTLNPSTPQAVSRQPRNR